MEDGEESEQTWRERYFMLEASLLKFRQQATQIKESLKVEMNDLREQKTEADVRANIAEEKLRVMEQQLAAVNWKPDDFERRIHELEGHCAQKDGQIRDLHCQLEDQRQLRQKDASLVEEKAAKIKQWVTDKLQQLEHKNVELETKNADLVHQVETLRDRLQSLPPFAAKYIHRNSHKEDGTSSDSNETSMPTSPQESLTRSHDTMNQSDNSQQNRVYENMRNHSLEADKSYSGFNSVKPQQIPKSVSYTENIKEYDTRSLSSYNTSRPESELGASRSESEAIYARPNKRPSSSIIEALQIEQELFGLEAESPGPEKDDYRDDMESPISDDESEGIDMVGVIAKPCNSSFNKAGVTRFCNNTNDIESEISDDKSEGIDIDISGNVSEDSMEDPLYQEVDQNHESTYEPKRSMPPQIRIERKLFQDINRMDSFVSSSNDSEDLLERNQKFMMFGGSDKPTMTVEPISRGLTFEEENLYGTIGASHQGNQNHQGHPSPRSPRSPRSPYAPPTPFLPLSPQLPDLVTPPVIMEHQNSGFFLSNSSSNTVSAIATLPRRPRDRHKPGYHTEDSNMSQTTSPTQSELANQLVSVEVHNTPATASNLQPRLKQTAPKPAGRARFNTWTTSPTQSELANQLVSVEVHNTPVTASNLQPRLKQTAPKPAGRARFNTWGAKSFQNTARPKQRREPSSGDQFSARDLFQDVSVPVYATLKGKAQQIRSTPFTEESAESSEDEGSSDDAFPQTPISPTRSRRQINQSTSGALKRGVCRNSPVSEASGDYANPPETTSMNSDSDTTEPEQKLLKYEQESGNHDTLDKCGYLSKLGGKVKTWKKRWFVLRGSDLFYYKTQHDMLKKPQGSIKIDDQTKISRTHGELSFEVTNSKRTYYLCADTYSETDRWVRVLQKLLKKQATSFLLDQIETKAVMKGHLTKVRNGITKRCWCVLLGGYFLCYRTSTSKTPFGQMQLRDARLEEILTPSESDDESNTSTPRKYVIAIWPPYQGPTYLIVPTKQEKDTWLYHLTVAAGGGTGNVGTPYEQLIAKLMQVEGDSNCVFWKHPMLLHAKDSITSPLTTLPSKQLQRQAVELFKTVQNFMCTMIESHSLDVHVKMAQSILQQCIQSPQLQNELYCQLIKQTCRHPVQNRSTVQSLLLCGKHSWYLCHASPSSPTNSMVDLATESKSNPPSYVIIQGWQLLCMCVSLFIPKQSVMWLLKLHLQRHADTRSDIGKYAIFCQRALDRTIRKGLREVKPSRMEVMSILLRHPYHHSQPISIPVHFLNNTYQVVSFDGSTTVHEFLQTISKTIGAQDSLHSGFALLSDDPNHCDTELCFQNHIKICDVIGRWEEVYEERHGGRCDTSKIVKLIYKNRLYFKSLTHLETDRDRLLLAYQINEEIIHGRFPLNRDLALELASLMAQIEYGDVKMGDPSTIQQLSQVLERFYPRKYRDIPDDTTRQLQEKLVDRWSSLRSRNQQDCVRVYLTVTRKWQFCGAKLFLTRMRESTSTDDIWLAVQEEGVALLEYSTMQPLHMYDYRSVVTFGGWNEDLMIVVSQLIEPAPHHYEHRTDKLLFILPQIKYDREMHSESAKRQSSSYNDSPPLDNANMVSTAIISTGRSSNNIAKSGKHSSVTSQGRNSSSGKTNGVNSMQAVRKSYRNRGFSKSATRILMASWRNSTKQEYQVYIKRWFQFCSQREIDKICVSVVDVVDFLTEEFERGQSYSSINIARSALSSLGIVLQKFTAGTHPMVVRFMKGVYHLRPSVSRYTHIWDVDKVLKYLQKLSPVKNLSLKDLTLKLVMLFALVNAARTQSIHLLLVTQLQKFSSEFVFTFESLLKQSRPTFDCSSFHIKAYPPDRRLCPYFVLKEYLSRTKKLRDVSEEKLLISYVKPHGAVSKDTIARWIRTVMCRAGIDTEIFGAHSVRAAAASKAKKLSVPIQDIMKKAGWSCESTFAKFYDKKIVESDKVSRAILRLP